MPTLCIRVVAVCSLCIRSNLEFQERTDKARCPQCRKLVTAQELRGNIALAGLAQQYMAVRALLVDFAAASTRRSSVKKGSQQASQANAARGAREDPQRTARPSRAASRALQGDVTSHPVTDEGGRGERAVHGQAAGTNAAAGRPGGAERRGVGDQRDARGNGAAEEGLLKERVRDSRGTRSNRAVPDGSSKRGALQDAAAMQGRVLRSRPGVASRPDKENATQETSEGNAWAAVMLLGIFMLPLLLLVIFRLPLRCWSCLGCPYCG